MNNKLVAGWLMVGVLVILAPATVDAQIAWSGAGGDNLWSNPDNWVGGAVPTASNRVLINGPAATEPNGPVIEDGIEAVTELLIADFGEPTMTMTGGTLELTGWGTWWGDAAGTIATFNQSGGTVTFTGGPGIMELGWQEPSDPIGSG